MKTGTQICFQVKDGQADRQKERQASGRGGWRTAAQSHAPWQQLSYCYP